jgi:hypothetical protein
MSKHEKRKSKRKNKHNPPLSWGNGPATPAQTFRLSNGDEIVFGAVPPPHALVSALVRHDNPRLLVADIAVVIGDVLSTEQPSGDIRVVVAWAAALADAAERLGDAERGAYVWGVE